ncbi:MAG: hypothetical protein JOZ45_11220 [Acidobacteriaceae bacterium]|nr:hypothetical protein [Acidobacteriaceae bacterium]
MRRALLIFLGLALVTFLEFCYFPGHSYLQGESQTFVPMLERLDAPGFLSRDLVAISPHLTYTIYDEVTLFLHRLTKQSFENVLLGQLLLSRAAALLGIFLLILSTGLNAVCSVLLSALINLGAALPGIDELLIGREPVPHVLAFGFTLLALGCLADRKPLLASFAGGVALAYHAPIAALFWLIAFILLFDRKLRPLVRPMLPIFVVFALLLANLAQLQPGVVEPQSFFSQISKNWSRLQQEQTPLVWVGTWAGKFIWIYLGVFALGAYATARIWPTLNRPSRWLFVVLPSCGILSVPFSAFFLDYLRWSLISQLQPARTLLFTVALASVAFGLAGIQALQKRRTPEACLWFLLIAAVPLSAAVFQHEGRIPEPVGIEEVATWAEANTWGSSMFLFPDAGRALYPGVFRARAVRAVYVDWNSRQLTKYFEKFALEWDRRWRETMSEAYSPQRLNRFRKLPIDYYVLQRRHQLAGAAPVFASENFVVYDAQDLKNRTTLFQ